MIYDFIFLQMDPKTSKIVAEWFKNKYREIDRKMYPLSGICKKGCDWCCFQSVEILNWEEPLILNYISQQLSYSEKSRIRKKLLIWFDYFDETMQQKKILVADEIFVKFQQQQAVDRIPCPFLYNHECSIYPVRPLCCRMHVNESHPGDCRANPLKDSSPQAEELRKVTLASIVNRIPTSLHLLNFAIAPLFKLEHRVPVVEHALLKGI